MRTVAAPPATLQLAPCRRRRRCGASRARADASAHARAAPDAPAAAAAGNKGEEGQRSLAEWLAWARTGAGSNARRLRSLSTAALAASLLETPAPLRRAAAADARRHTSELFAGVFYGGDVAKLDADFRFYGDGFALLARDVRRDAPLLLASGPLTERQHAARERVAEDLRALVPFSLVLMNTWPFTKAMLQPVLQWRWRGASVPRRWLLPSTFEDERLASVARARRLAERAAAGKSQ